MNSAAILNLLGVRFDNASLCAKPALEDTYRHLFLRELKKIGEEDIYFPVGGAANYSLLYLILRTAVTYRPKRVLDVGCGQTTLLWDRLAKRGLAGQVVTLENDPEWAAQIGGRVQHEMLVTKLRRTVVAGAPVQTYDWDEVRARGPFDIIAVDGPRGESQRSRCGVLSLLDASLPQDFILMLDDAERPGEQETVGLIHERLDVIRGVYATGAVQAAKSQVIFAGGAYSGAAHF